MAGSGTPAAFADLRTDRIFYEGDLGTYGYFNAGSPPVLEVLCDAVDPAHQVYLTVIRIP